MNVVLKVFVGVTLEWKLIKIGQNWANGHLRRTARGIIRVIQRNWDAAASTRGGSAERSRANAQSWRPGSRTVLGIAIYCVFGGKWTTKPTASALLWRNCGVVELGWTWRDWWTPRARRFENLHLCRVLQRGIFVLFAYSADCSVRDRSGCLQRCRHVADFLVSVLTSDDYHRVIPRWYMVFWYSTSSLRSSRKIIWTSRSPRKFQTRIRSRAVDSNPNHSLKNLN